MKTLKKASKSTVKKAVRRTLPLSKVIGDTLKVVEFKSKKLNGYYGAVDLGSTIKVVVNAEAYQPNHVHFKDEQGMDFILPEGTLIKSARKKDATQKMQDYVAFNRAKLETCRRWEGKVGSDPEIFVTTKEGDLIPAFLFLGSKKEPTMAPRTTGGGAHGGNKVYWDGFQAEFETEPQTCLSWQIDSIQTGLQGVFKAARQYNKDAKLTVQNLFEIPQQNLASTREEHASFGCSPSLNAYGHRPLMELDGRSTTLRSAGGHIHFGSNGLQSPKAIEIVKTLDAVLGVACVSLFQGIDDARRRLLYGLAGEFRMPAHGLEYRVLSNAWLSHPFITNVVFDLARSVAKMGVAGLRTLWQTTEQETVRIINTCDVAAAQEQLKTNKGVLMALLRANYYDVTNQQTCYDVIFNGLSSVIKDPNDVIGNWNLNGNWQTHCDGYDKNVNMAAASIRAGRKLS